MSNDNLLHRIQAVSDEQFSRSGGPGGQNVNKVNTQVTLHIPLQAIGLSKAQLQRVHAALSNRISSEGELVLHCSQSRSQAANRELVLQRAVELIGSAIAAPRRRRPTKPSRASQERRLQQKKIRSSHKRARKKPPRDD